jgi:hypothetical protein
MNATLRVGSRGPGVVSLQQLLNTAPPPGAVKLVPDGAFGPRTLGRVRQAQQLLGLLVDGIVGPMTWAALEALGKATGGATPVPPPLPDARRLAIATKARAELTAHGVRVHAKAAGGKDPTTGRTLRAGHDRLLDYFRLTSPDPKKPGSTYWGDDAVKFLGKAGERKPMPHWCGIFALWVVKSTGRHVGTWKMGHGINAVTGFKQVTVARAGDIVVKAQPFQHHAIVEKIELIGGQSWIHSIDGNSGFDSTITSNKHPASHWSHVFSVTELA